MRTDTPIAEIMTRPPITVHPDLAVEDLITLFLEHNISRVPVVDATGALIGIVSKTDLVVDQYVRGDTDVEQRDAAVEPGFHVHGGDNIVRDVMTPVVFTLKPTTTIAAAAERMLAENVHAMPVVEAGRVVGMFSTTDVVAWVARTS